MPRVCVPVLMLVLACGCTLQQEDAPDSTPQATLRRGCQYLWSQQAEDGGWHSRTYGLLKSGQSLSGFVLNALLQVPPQTCQAPAGGVDQALLFLRRNTSAEGA